MPLLRRSPAETRQQQVVDRNLKVQVRKIRGLVEALMFDTSAWLATAFEPVTPQLCPDYLFNELRMLPHPGDRMRHYVGLEQLQAWAEVLDRWVASGRRLQPYLGQRLELDVEGLGSGEPVRASFRFSNQSIVVMGGHREYCSSDWLMMVQISPNLKRIDTCVLRPVPAAR